MIRWGICTTLNAPQDEMLAFVAHHLDLGAAHIWLHFDDPADPAAALAARLPQVTAICCDAKWWQSICKKRPDAHQNRQARNMQRLYARTPLPWIAHLDVDEFLVADRPVADILAALAPDRPMLRAAPWEALHEPALTDDIFTARYFRASQRGASHSGSRIRTLGDFAAILPDGALSHSVGKCFFRTGIHKLQPRLHGAFLDGERVPGGPFDPDLALLHFHAQDRDRWLARLPFRLERGGYRGRPLQTYLAQADAAGIAAFYDVVQGATQAQLGVLRDLGLLREVHLDLRGKVETLIKGITP